MKSTLCTCRIFATFLLVCFQAAAADASTLLLKLKTTGTLPTGALVAGWSAAIRLPASNVTIITNPATQQLAATSFYASGVTPSTYFLLGSFNAPDAVYTVPYLKVASLGNVSDPSSGTLTGEVATIVLSIAAGAPLPVKSAFSLLDTVITSSASGAPLAGVNLDFDLVPGPTPGKAGDCDSNGFVTSIEVQSAVNMFLGIKTVAACVDTGGDSRVSIAEVQKAINGLLGL